MLIVSLIHANPGGRENYQWHDRAPPLVRRNEGGVGRGEEALQAPFIKANKSLWISVDFARRVATWCAYGIAQPTRHFVGGRDCHTQ